MEPKWNEVVDRACAQLKRMLTDYQKEIQTGFDHIDVGKPYKIDSKIILTEEADHGLLVDSVIAFDLAKKVTDHIESKVGGKQLDLPLGDPLAGKE
jgi:hypothetical protein